MPFVSNTASRPPSRPPSPIVRVWLIIVCIIRVRVCVCVRTVGHVVLPFRRTACVVPHGNNNVCVCVRICLVYVFVFVFVIILHPDY